MLCKDSYKIIFLKFKITPLKIKNSNQNICPQISIVHSTNIPSFWRYKIPQRGVNSLGKGLHWEW